MRIMEWNKAYLLLLYINCLKKKVKSSWKIIIIVLNSFQLETLRPIKDNKIIEDKKEDKIYATRGISHSPSGD